MKKNLKKNVISFTNIYGRRNKHTIESSTPRGEKREGEKYRSYTIRESMSSYRMKDLGESI